MSAERFQKNPNGAKHRVCIDPTRSHAALTAASFKHSALLIDFWNENTAQNRGPENQDAGAGCGGRW